jgi:RNA 2',3'-cyclic 3'-phosphodiesterase
VGRTRKNDRPLLNGVRLFVAIEVGPEAPETSGDGRGAVQHLTLRFLGEVPSERVPSIVTALEPVARETAPFDLVLDGVGAFPSRSNPRVVWVGATAGRTEADELAQRIALALTEAPGTRERESFVPHLTLFRVRSSQLRRRAIDLLNGTEPPPGPRTVRVTEFVLKESTLTPRGAIHRTLATFPLALLGHGSAD